MDLFCCRNFVLIITGILVNTVAADLLDTERATFFGLTHEIPFSISTVELVEQLYTVVWQHAQGNRRVRRYFDSYDTPFVGQGRRRMDHN
ncbi:unnamed protein product, partial [Iphiclides podalirius]